MPEPRPLPPVTVLVVDDEPTVRQLTQRLLAAAGYHVFEATDGIEALDILRTIHVDLVLTDMMMPRMGGAELVRELRQRWPAQYVLCMSAEAGEVGAHVRVDDVPVPFLRKPFTRAELLAKVADALHLASTPPSAARVTESYRHA